MTYKEQVIDSLIQELKARHDQFAINYQGPKVKSIDIGGIVIDFDNYSVDTDDVCKKHGISIERAHRMSNDYATLIDQMQQLADEIAIIDVPATFAKERIKNDYQ